MNAGTGNRVSAEAPDGIAGGPGPAVEIEPNTDDLRDYVRAKHALASQVRILREALKALGREHGERQCGELTVKLAEDRFTLAVLGQFKRGKSSLMNAIIGRELLPTGVLPLTSAITVLKYGPAERLLVCRDDKFSPEEWPMAALADYVTEKGNPGNRLKIKTVCLELPVPFLRRGIEFVDTPGVGSAIAANTATTCGFLSECDAALFVTGVDTPMTSLELAFLKEIREYVDKIFFVVNKTDLAADGEREEVLRFVRETIRTQAGCARAKVFPVSARLGLAARTASSVSLYDQSGLKDLEEALAAFLSKEKSVAFLASIARKALRIWEEEDELGAFQETALQAREQVMQQKGFDAPRRDPHVAAAAAKAAREKLETWLADILHGRMAGIATATAPASGGANAEAANGSAPSTSAKVELSTDLRIRGCPICRQIEASAWDFFARWQYAIATEEQAQGQFAAELGFCPLHTWQLQAVSSPHGASIGFARLAEQMARHLKESEAAAARSEAVRRIVRDAQNCRVCALRRQVEKDAVSRLAARMGEASGQDVYRRSQGVCLRHLAMLLDSGSTPGGQDFLIRHAAQRFEEDAEDMQGFAMKDEALRRASQNRDEKDAYQRAVIRMVGSRDACMPWQENA